MSELIKFRIVIENELGSYQSDVDSCNKEQYSSMKAFIERAASGKIEYLIIKSTQEDEVLNHYFNEGILSKSIITLVKQK